MTPAEAAALLAVAAAFDNRKPDADAAAAWSLALDGLRFVDCREVVVEHYRRTNDWLMPSHVITEVRRLREKRIALAGDLTPPPDLTPMQTITWLGDARRRIGDGEPAPESYAELGRHPMPDLSALMPRLEPAPRPVAAGALRGEEGTT